MKMEIEGTVYLTTAEAKALADEMGEKVSSRSITAAAQRGKDGIESGIAGAVQMGGTRKAWLFPRDEFIIWLRNRRPRGPKPQN